MDKFCCVDQLIVNSIGLWYVNKVASCDSRVILAMTGEEEEVYSCYINGLIGAVCLQKNKRNTSTKLEFILIFIFFFSGDSSQMFSQSTPVVSMAGRERTR